MGLFGLSQDDNGNWNGISMSSNSDAARSSSAAQYKLTNVFESMKFYAYVIIPTRKRNSNSPSFRCKMYLF